MDETQTYNIVQALIQQLYLKIQNKNVRFIANIFQTYFKYPKDINAHRSETRKAPNETKLDVERQTEKRHENTLPWKYFERNVNFFLAFLFYPVLREDRKFYALRAPASLDSKTYVGSVSLWRVWSLDLFLCPIYILYVFYSVCASIYGSHIVTEVVNHDREKSDV